MMTHSPRLAVVSDARDKCQQGRRQAMWTRMGVVLVVVVVFGVSASGAGGQPAAGGTVADLGLRLDELRSKTAKTTSECALRLPDGRWELHLDMANDWLAKLGDPRTLSQDEIESLSLMVQDITALASYVHHSSDVACRIHDQYTAALAHHQQQRTTVRAHLLQAVRSVLPTPGFPTRQQFARLGVDRFGLTTVQAYDYARLQFDRPAGISVFSIPTKPPVMTSRRLARGRGNKMTVTLRQKVTHNSTIYTFTEELSTTTKSEATLTKWVAAQQMPDQKFTNAVRVKLATWSEARCRRRMANHATLLAAAGSHAPDTTNGYYHDATRELVARVVEVALNDGDGLCRNSRALSALVDGAVDTVASSWSPHPMRRKQFNDYRADEEAIILRLSNALLREYLFGSLGEHN